MHGYVCVVTLSGFLGHLQYTPFNQHCISKSNILCGTRLLFQNVSLSLSVVLKTSVWEAGWGDAIPLKAKSSQFFTQFLYNQHSTWKLPDMQHIRLSCSHHFQCKYVTALFGGEKKIIGDVTASVPGLQLENPLYNPHAKTISLILPGGQQEVLSNHMGPKLGLLWARGSRTERVNALTSKLRKHHRATAIWSRANPWAEFIIASLTNVCVCSPFLG